MQNWLSDRIFERIHSGSIIYNTCWEDPRIDRQALELKSDDKVVLITSAGCNALDYVLAGAAQVTCVDVNPKQNALLELKIAGIRGLEFAEFFEMFGRGRLSDPRWKYERYLRRFLPEYAQKFWDSNIECFAGRGLRSSFYYHGTSGLFARLIRLYLDRFVRARGVLDDLLKTDSLLEQREIYERKLKPLFWSKPLRWFLNRDLTLGLLGVPTAQRRQIERTFPGGVVKFIENCIDSVFGGLPVNDNYFYRVYLTGEYTRECCPEYLKEENFLRLKNGGWEKIAIFTGTLLEFLKNSEQRFSRFVLLDHMDWLADRKPEVLQQEWQAILDRASGAGRVIWRSGGLYVDYVDPLQVYYNGKERTLGEILSYRDELAKDLHKRDRVHTYGSFYIADLPMAA